MSAEGFRKLLAFVDGHTVPAVAHMQQVGADLLVITPDAGVSVAVFQLRGSPIEIALSTETDMWRIKLGEPVPGEAVTVTHKPDGTVECRYVKA